MSFAVTFHFLKPNLTLVVLCFLVHRQRRGCGLGQDHQTAAKLDVHGRDAAGLGREGGGLSAAWEW